MFGRDAAHVGDLLGSMAGCRHFANRVEPGDALQLLRSWRFLLWWLIGRLHAWVTAELPIERMDDGFATFHALEFGGVHAFDVVGFPDRADADIELPGRNMERLAVLQPFRRRRHCD